MNSLIKLIQQIGKGPGFITLGLLEAALGAWVVSINPDAALPLAGLYTSINTFVYTTGAWKAHAEAKYLPPYKPGQEPKKEEPKP